MRSGSSSDATQLAPSASKLDPVVLVTPKSALVVLQGCRTHLPPQVATRSNPGKKACCNPHLAKRGNQSPGPLLMSFTWKDLPYLSSLFGHRWVRGQESHRRDRVECRDAGKWRVGGVGRPPGGGRIEEEALEYSNLEV
jgi:hypothetical protein